MKVAARGRRLIPNFAPEPLSMIPLSMDLVRVTEAAAIAAIPPGSAPAPRSWPTRPPPTPCATASTVIHFAARIVIGEGIKDDSFGLFSGEAVGRWRDDPRPGSAPVYELCVDPIEGRPTVHSGPEAISVLGAAEGGRLSDGDRGVLHAEAGLRAGNRRPVGHLAGEAPRTDRSQGRAGPGQAGRPAVRRASWTVPGTGR